MSIATTLNITATKSSDLLTKTGQLIDAINAENIGDILSKSLALINNIKDLVDSFQGIKTGLSGIGIPDANQVPEKLTNYLLYKYFDQIPGFYSLT